MAEITANTTSDPNPVDRKAMSIPALTTQIVPILRMVIGISPRSPGKAELGLFQNRFVCRRNDFFHEAVMRCQPIRKAR